MLPKNPNRNSTRQTVPTSKSKPAPMGRAIRNQKPTPPMHRDNRNSAAVRALPDRSTVSFCRSDRSRSRRVTLRIHLRFFAREHRSMRKK